MRFVAVLFAGVVSVVACGPSTTDTCNQFAVVWCKQQYTCASGANLSALQAKYGADANACATSYAAFNCSAQPCPAGTSYDTGRATQCTNEYSALTCTDIQNNTQLSDCNFNYICH